MDNMYNKVLESADYIKNHTTYKRYDVAIVLGSGLGKLIDSLEDKEYVYYKDIPHFPQSTVAGHEGRLVLGTVNGVTVLAMQGRFHYYEGYTMKEVTYPIYVMKLLGIEKLILTNACGGINLTFEPGTLMLITDFINLFGDNPLIGVNDERFGARFVDMSEPYDLKWIEKASIIGDTLNVNYKQGIYAGFIGPYYETAAEILSIKTQGADAVGMSTVPETIAANYLGLRVLGISCITNMATGIQKQKHSHQRVVEIAEKSSVSLCQWVTKIIETINP